MIALIGGATSRRITVSIMVAAMMMLTAGPALAKKDPATTEIGATVEAPTPTEVSQSLTDSTTLFEVALRVGLIDKKGNVEVPSTGEGVTIAMIDTGVVPVGGLAHSNVVYGPDFTPEDMYDDMRSLDTNGHGTHLAGIMVGSDAAWLAGDRRRSGDRLLGMAPDATLLSVKAGSSDGATDISQVIAAINWVVGQKVSGETDIDILNLAFSADSSELYLTDPLTYAVERAWDAGIVVVVAAGNEGKDQWRLTSPARDPRVIAVGASELTAKDESVADYTSSGLLRAADIHAPGSSIVSLRNPGSWSDQFNESGRIGDDLVRASGTSQATAVMSGLVALLLEARPDLTPDEVKQVLLDSATLESTDGFSPLRFVDIARAVDQRVDGATQWVLPADGSGSIDASRGELRLYLDGVALEGEIDVFGNDWSGSRWTADAWTGSRWTGSRWTTDVWAGVSWAGSRWTTSEWSGSRWTGSRWTEADWSGSRWTATDWSGSRWTGSRWTNVDWT